MKIDKNKIIGQRSIIVSKLQNWKMITNDKAPPSGWIKAIRGALGMTSYQLAKRMGVNQATVVRYEMREAEGKITLDTLKNAAQAMDCKLVYAIVPNDEYSSLEDMIKRYAEDYARKILKRTEHTMQLEKQGTGTSSAELDKLVKELIDNVDSRIWNKGPKE